MSYLENMAEHRRLDLLLLLKQSDGQANEDVLRTALQRLGHMRATKDTVRADGEWLAERGAVRVEWIEDRIMVLRLRQRGLDAAEGNVEIEGVRRPSIVSD